MAKKQDGASVVWSMMVLCMTLVFIYAIFFGVRGDDIRAHTQALAAKVEDDANNVKENIVENDPTGVADQLLDTGEPNKVEPMPEIDENVKAPEEPVSARPADLPGRQFHSFKELFEETIVPESDQIELEGTWGREGYMKSLEATSLDEYAQYILKNMDNTHFVFLGDFDPTDRQELITKKWGNLVAIEGETAISQNQLLGDKVIFINLPEYKNIKVLMLVFFEDAKDVWFIQIDHDTYYAKKDQLGPLFAPWYK